MGHHEDSVAISHFLEGVTGAMREQSQIKYDFYRKQPSMSEANASSAENF